jgi:signal transduction histidine kinase
LKTRSVVRQTIAVILLAELFCVAAFTGTALVHEWQVRLRALDITLQGRSDSLLGAIQDAEDPDDNVTIDPHELFIPATDTYAVYNQGGRLLGASKDAPDELIKRNGDGYSTREVQRGSYRVLEREGMRIIDRPENDGVGLQRPVTILYAMRDDGLWREVLKGASFYIGLSAALILLSGTLMVILLRRAMRPLQELASAASAVSVRTLEFIPPDSALQLRELQPLATTLSATIERLRNSFDQQHRFVGDAAHELKTAIAVTRSSIQLMMLRPRAAPEYVEGLDALLQDNIREGDLVTRMLTLARVEERQNMVPGPIDIALIAEDAVRLLKNFAETHDVGLRAEIESPVMVRIAADALRVLVSNLVVNAVQYSPPGSSVEVGTMLRGDSAVLLVRDHGAGIAAEALPHVFERFYREDSSRSRATGGAGLGLAICKSIVEGAGGTIGIESVLGGGTTITVILPV